MAEDKKDLFQGFDALSSMLYKDDGSDEPKAKVKVDDDDVDEPDTVVDDDDKGDDVGDTDEPDEVDDNNKGDDDDKTRKKEYYDGTYEYLKNIGITEI